MVLLRKIAVSTFARRVDSSWPPADAVIPSATRALLGGPERARTPPGDLLQGQPQGLGVGEFTVQQAERGLQRRKLLVGERDRGQVEVLRSQRVVLLLGRAVGRALDGELYAQRFELGAVGVEAPGKGILVHAAVALDVAPDLKSSDGSALGHQIGDQRQLADQLLGVLCHSSKA